MYSASPSSVQDGQAIEGAQLNATQGLGHRRVLSEPEVLRSVSSFLGR